MAMKYLLFLLGAIWCIRSESLHNKLYENSKLIKITNFPKDPAHNLARAFETELGCRIWRETNTEIELILKPNDTAKVKDFIAKKNLKLDVVINDVQKAVDNELTPVLSRGVRKMDWQTYHSYDVIMRFLDDMKNSYPSLVTLEKIGESIEGRSLKVLRISENPEGNNKIWLDGGIHAREWISPAVTTFIINSLLSRWSTLPKSITTKTWYIMPLINPDGYEYSRNYDRLWRKNRRPIKGGDCDGVDLNRNWDADWNNKRQSTNPCTEVYRGTKPFSEPETLAVFNFLNKNQNNLKAFLTFHSYGQHILYPYGYTMNETPDYKKMESAGIIAAQKIQKQTGVTYTVEQSNTLGLISGGSDDWAKKFFNLPYAYTIELRDAGRNGFLLPESQILSTGLEGFNIIESIANAIP